MPLPSKQNMVYASLMKIIREEYTEGAKLPAEAALAARIGVTRRTLRRTLARLESEGMLDRTNRGTFIRKPDRVKGDVPITVLVPCPNYLTASGYWSSYLTHQMILGAREAAVEAGTYAVTLPITVNNDPADIDFRQFQHLDSDSMVMISGVKWAPSLPPFLCGRSCRCGIISDEAVNVQEFEQRGTPLWNYYLDDYSECLGDAVKQLRNDGVQGRILYFGRSSTDISKYGKKHFLAACAETGLECSEAFYALYDRSLSCHSVLALLRDLYQQAGFNGLIFDSGFFYELPSDFDFFGESAIPRRTRLILSVSELLRQPDLPAHTRVLHRPQRKTAREIAKFLLSGQRGQFCRRFRYEFPLLEEFFSRTGI